MPELDEPVGDVCGIEAKVFGIEPLASAPVTDRCCDEDSAAADAIEERLILGTVGWIHDMMLVWWLVGVFRGKWNARPVQKGPDGRGLGDGGCGCFSVAAGHQPDGCGDSCRDSCRDDGPGVTAGDLQKETENAQDHEDFEDDADSHGEWFLRWGGCLCGGFAGEAGKSITRPGWGG